MKITKSLSVVTCASIGLFLLFSHQKYPSMFQPQVIYGRDNRTELADSSDPRVRDWGRSVLAQIPRFLLDDGLNLLSQSLGETFLLCPHERFFNQLSSAACSGFLAATDIVITAGHCVKTKAACQNYVWAFDYIAGTTRFAPEQVYRCKKIIKRVEDAVSGLDYAILQLDRPVFDRTPLKMRTSGEIQIGQAVAIIGHSGGLPVKVADDALVLRNRPDWPFFISNLDAFEGSSGSPVFNLDSGLVEGILTKGEPDYHLTLDSNFRPCQTSRICSFQDCDGEEILKARVIEGFPKF